MIDTINKTSGVWPVMLTPFTEDNQVDAEGLKFLVEWYIQNNVSGLFAACQSSEIFNLSLRERLNIARITIEQTNGRVPIVASGNTSDSLQDQADELNSMWKLGADAVVLLSNRLAGRHENAQVWIENLKKLLDLLDPDMKLGIYECPYPYKRVISPEEMEAIIASGRFCFIKDTCSDSLVIRRKLAQMKGTRIRLFNANTTTLLGSLRDGADGYCGVMANFHPELYVWLCSNIRNKNAEKVSDVLTMCSLIEKQLYPTNAKWHLRNLRNVPIQDYCRVQDSSLLTETFKQEITAMERLVKDTYDTYCLNGQGMTQR